MSEMEVLKPPFSRNAEADALAKRFCALAIGEVVTYVEVGKLIKETAQSDGGRSITARARRAVLRDENIVIECIPKIGFRRVSDADKVVLGKRQIGKVRRAVKRGAQVIKATDTAKLNGEERVAYTLTVSWYGALSQATRRGMAKRIERAVQASEDIRAGDILRLMGGKS